MERLFDYGDVVQYDHPKHGKGKGVVVGANDDQTEFVVYPKQKLKTENYKYQCIICKPSQLINTPF